MQLCSCFFDECHNRIDLDNLAYIYVNRFLIFNEMDYRLFGCGIRTQTVVPLSISLFTSTVPL